ncbi:MAG: hypothetical protein ACHQAZ_01220 [Gammaproteobacteria bacterium]
MFESLNMRNILPLGAVILLAAYALPGRAIAAPAAGQEKADSLIREFSDISRDLHRLQTTQAALVQQKAAIDATAADLAKRQDDLNQQEQAHNQLATEQKQALDQNKSQCNNKDFLDGKNTLQHVNDCDNAIKKLNTQTVAIDVGTLPLQTQQTGLDLAYAQYNQTTNDWNVQEQETMTALNSVYRAMNDWADQADDLMTSQGFRNEMYVNHAEKYCSQHELPDGVIDVEELLRYANSADGCLKYVTSLRSDAH